jgi:hypothetical protein
LRYHVERGRPASHFRRVATHLGVSRIGPEGFKLSRDKLFVEKHNGTTTLFSALNPKHCGKSDEVPDLTDSFFAHKLPLR